MDVIGDEVAPAALKYTRLGGVIPCSLRKRGKKQRAEVARHLGASDRLLVLATESGGVHVLDLGGEPMRSFLGAHSMPVNCVHMDDGGEYVASCSDEGRVVVHELYGEDAQAFEYGEAVSCVRLGPQYARQRGVAVGTADGKVRLKSKNWFGQVKDELIHADEGAIDDIAWESSGVFLAWSSAIGVKIFDCVKTQIISHLQRPVGWEAGTRCHLCWVDSATLLVGWGRTVRKVAIRRRDSSLTSPRAVDSTLSIFNVSVTFQMELSHTTVAGVAPWRGDGVLVLCVPAKSAPADPPNEPASVGGETVLCEYVSVARGMVREEFEMDSAPVGALEIDEQVLALETRVNPEGTKRVRFPRGWTSETAKDGKLILKKVDDTRRRPQLRLYNAAYELQFADVINCARCQECAPTTFQLRCAMSEEGDDTLYYIVAPHDLLVVKQWEATDHVSWLLDKGNVSAALSHAESQHANGTIGTRQLLQVAQRYIAEFVQKGDFEGAAKQCARLLAKADSSSWERWVYEFAASGNLRPLAHCLPTGSPRLRPAVYELVLQIYICSHDHSDHESALELLRRWPETLYTASAVIALLSCEIQKEMQGSDTVPALMTKRFLVECLCLLLSRCGEHRHSLELRLSLELSTVRQSRKQHTAELSESSSQRICSLFDYMEQHRLQMGAESFVRPLLELDELRTIQFLVRHLEDLPVGIVALQLQRTQSDLGRMHAYLQEAFEKDPRAAPSLHDAHVEYLCEHTDEDALLQFLMLSTHYTLESTLAMCNSKSLYRATVFVLGRMGRSMEALDLIFEKIHDMEMAIDFVKSRPGPVSALWQELLRRALAESPSTATPYISQLLQQSGGFVDPLVLIEQLPTGLEIPGMRDMLVQIIREHHFGLNLRNASVRIVERDSYELSKCALNERRRAHTFDACSATAEGKLQLQLSRENNKATEVALPTFSSTGLIVSGGDPSVRSARQKRLARARMSREEFSNKFLQASTVDVRPLGSPSAESARIARVAGLDGQIEASELMNVLRHTYSGEFMRTSDVSDGVEACGVTSSGATSHAHDEAEALLATAGSSSSTMASAESILAAAEALIAAAVPDLDGDGTNSFSRNTATRNDQVAGRDERSFTNSTRLAPT